MALMTPFASAATPADAAVSFPAATSAAARTVDDANAPGAACAASADRHAASAPPETASPRRVSRAASVRRAAVNRLDSVPSGTPSLRAASLRDWPSKSHSTTAARYFSGRRYSSRSRMGRQSGGSSGPTAGCGASSTCRSRSRRRALTARASSDVRKATPYNQLPTDSRFTTDPALRQHQEGRLEGVLGVLLVTQQPSADAVDHGTVQPDQRRESRLVARGDEARAAARRLPAGAAPGGWIEGLSSTCGRPCRSPKVL